MLTCKDVAKAVAQDELDTGPWRRRLALRCHLLMCRHYRRYAAQIRAIGTAVHSLLREHGDNPKALERLESARQIDRAVADRIGDYEQALEILEGIAAEAPKQQPADLAEVIEQARRELERLTLQEFFP